MKAILLFALVLVAANSYNLWDNWHNVPTTWVPSNSTSTTWGLSGWKRNGVDGQHFSGEFNDYSQIFTQYLYWQESNPETLLICGPKYYIHSTDLCRVNPYFRASGMPEYCLPNYYNFANKDDVCGTTNPLYGTYQCCYDNAVNSSPDFLKDMTSTDPYSTPLF